MLCTVKGRVFNCCTLFHTTWRYSHTTAFAHYMLMIMEHSHTPGGMRRRTCTKPSAATWTLPVLMSHRHTYSPSCASVLKCCCRPHEGSVKNTEGPFTTQLHTCNPANLYAFTFLAASLASSVASSVPSSPSSDFRILQSGKAGTLPENAMKTAISLTVQAQSISHIRPQS